MYPHTPSGPIAFLSSNFFIISIISSLYAESSVETVKQCRLLRHHVQSKREYTNTKTISVISTRNFLALHAKEHGHFPRWNDTQVLHEGMKKGMKDYRNCVYCHRKGNQSQRRLVSLAEATDLLIIGTARDRRCTNQLRDKLVR